MRDFSLYNFSELLQETDYSIRLDDKLSDRLSNFLKSPDFYKSRAWLELRYDVLRAYGGVCSICKRRASPGNPIQVDHIKPRASGDPASILRFSNCQVMCRDCNQGKGTRYVDDWRTPPF